MNPHFSLLDAVVAKILRDQAQTVLIFPHWCNRWYFSAVQDYIQRCYLYAQGMKFFENDQGPMGPIRWPVWAALVDGGQMVKKFNLNTVDVDNPSYKRTIESCRRKRKKFRKGLC